MSSDDERESDYVSRSGTCPLTPAMPTHCVNIGIIDDSVTEDTECFNFILESPVGINIVIPQEFETTRVCIRDDDDIEGKYIHQEYTGTCEEIKLIIEYIAIFREEL